MLTYKYRGGNDDIFRRDLDGVVNNYFWSSNFETLNDPCENIVISDKFLTQTKSLSFLLSKKRKDALKNLHDAFENLLSVNKRIGIYSLSKSYLDELLWAHYANSHKGFCLEYDSELLLKSFKTERVYPFSVSYENKPPEITVADISIKNDGLIFKMTGFKSKRWEYEQEFRIITDNSGKQSYDYQSLKGIYFGLRMEESQKMEMMKKLCDREINFYQIELLDKTYKFKAVKIKNPFIPEVKYLSAIPASVTGGKKVDFKITENIFYKLNSKGTMTIELESVVSEKEIGWIATIINNQIFHTAERIYIFYNLKNVDLDMAWATAHTENGEIKITINNWPLDLL